MNFGISAIGFQPGKMGGMETYFRNLVNSLPQVDAVNSYELICGSSADASQFGLESPRFKASVLNFAKPSVRWMLRGMMRRILKVDILASVLDTMKLDVLHYPFTVMSPLGLRTPTVLTFWDMQHEFYPEFFSAAELHRRTTTYKSSVESATRVIVSAEFTKQCLVERYGADPEKIDVVYTGFGPEYQVIRDSDVLDRYREKYALDRPFLYYPAATWPHKNHKLLLQALSFLKQRDSFDGLLVLTGIAKQGQTELHAEIERLGLTAEVKMLGYLPYEDLPFLYNLARAMVFPSLFEGFGIPVVEAMACGCPVVCSNATSLPEVAGDAALLFDPNSAEDMARMISMAWGDEARRAGMKAKGLERVKLFDWSETARQTLKVYEKVAGGR